MKRKEFPSRNNQEVTNSRSDKTGMKEQKDPWYVRLPDGRTFKAKSTPAVLHHIEAGNIPLNSRVRRKSGEEWLSLAQVPEFSSQTVVGSSRSAASMAEFNHSNNSGSSPDIHLGAGVSARLDPLKLQVVGVRGYVDELYAAFDSTLVQAKLWVASLTGFAIAILYFLTGYWGNQFPEVPPLFFDIGFILSFVVIFTLGNVLITHQTHLELSQMEMVSFKKVCHGILPLYFRCLTALLILISLGLGLQYGFVLLCDLLNNNGVILLLAISAFPIGFILFFITILGILLPPIIAIEEGSLMDNFREWRALLREHRIRVVLYESLAVGLGIIACLPFAIPILATYLLQESVQLQNVIPVRWHMLQLGIQGGFIGIALGPLIAFMSVANVFIYLNLRYEYSPRK